MTEYSSASQITTQIKKTIDNAKHKLVLMSPFLRLSKTLYKKLKDANSRGVKINMICKNDTFNEDEKARIGSLENVSLHFYQDLCAKCFLNEDRMVITSMNMDRIPNNNNRETGILITKEDSQYFSSVIQQIQSIPSLSQIFT